MRLALAVLLLARLRLRGQAPPLRGLSSSASSSAAASFVCTSCGHDSRKWAGRCSACGEGKPRAAFSRTQFGKGPAARRCAACVAGAP